MRLNKRLVGIVVVLAVVLGLAVAYAMDLFPVSSGTVRLEPEVEFVRTIRGRECHFVYSGSFVVVMSAGSVCPAIMKQGRSAYLQGWDIVGGQIANVWHIDFTWASIDSSGRAVVTYKWGSGLSILSGVVW